MTLAQTVEAALRTYPSIRASEEQINAAAAGIQLARTAYLPRVDALAQVNRATRNNVFGLLLPQSVIPGISGPVIGSNNFGTVWGSAAGLLVSWEPFDFGFRAASVKAAGAVRAHSRATLDRTRFETAVAAADAYLTLAAAQETVRAAEAGVDRAETALRIITALSNAQLRPGADASRAQAELAAARTQSAQARQAQEIARANLALFAGIEPGQVAAAEPRLAELPPQQKEEAADIARNPIALEQTAAIAEFEAQLRALERSYFPRFDIQAAAYARGTGAELNGARLGALNGLAPTVQDFAVGFTVTFPVMELAALRARESAQSANIRAETARYDQIALELRNRWNTAVATLAGARNIAANTPASISAAQTVLQQATARYQSALGNVDDVAQAQRLLTQAEIDDALARLGVWRGLLAIASAAGDIQPFIAEISGGDGK